MKILRFIEQNILPFLTLFLLAFIPLYPKIPLVDIQNTWVYVRFEDVFVLLSLIVWGLLLLFKKVTLKTPLTLPIIMFWVIGGISTIHGVMLLFPTLPGVFSNVALLSYLRRIEYISLFFVAYWAIKDKKYISYVSVLLAVVMLLVVGYGFGQRYLGFPAYLTMNEEFAKGIPMYLSQLSRVPSTFGGQYDLAAYLVLMIPLLVSMAFGFRNWLMKVLLLVSASLGFGLLFMTVSRVSFIVLLLSLVMLLIIQKKRWVIVTLFILTFVFLSLSPSLLQRFGSTVSEVSVLVDAKTGAALGQVKEVPAKYFENKVVKKQFVFSGSVNVASSSAMILPYALIPPKVDLLIEPNSPNGESLPQGTSYINLPLSPIVKKLSEYYFEKTDTRRGSTTSEARVYYGDFVIKKAKAYDLSFTTRFQGEWPKTLSAFKRNIFLGSGYGSVSLAVDNGYLRLLGESGLLGFISFFSIFLIAAIYINKIFPKIDSPVVKSFVLGFAAGTFGLALNATLIDVFEASKIAFTFWLLMGITLGVLKLYKSDIDLFKEFKKAITSSYAIVIYLLVVIYSLFSSSLSYYFVGDDFTWLRWVADCNRCQPFSMIIGYFTNASGFFYRPGTKLYFDLMYSAFWLNQTTYHFVSIFLHFVAVMLVFSVSKKVLKNFLLSVAAAFLFLILSGYSEAVFWISSTGFLFNAVFALLGLLFFIFWKEKRKGIYFILSFVSIVLSLLFHEVGVIAPLLVILYDIVFGEKLVQNLLPRKVYYSVLLFPLLPYFLMRLIAQSHWFNGDYGYNILKLPFNIVGNAIGYLGLILLGPSTLNFYEKLRDLSRAHLVVALLGSIVFLFAFVLLYRLIIKKISPEEKRIVIFGFFFFIVSLLPFIGLGNISSRYSYLPSFGVLLILVVLLKKIYEYLLSNGKAIAIAIIIVITIVFSANHLFQVQKIQGDWNNAGKKSESFLITLDWIYAHSSEEDISQLYFVNVPIRNGDAWVFPVGLKDAVWLVFRNKNVTVHQVKSAKEAFDLIGNSFGKVFQFDDKGKLIEMIKTQSGEIVPRGQ